jgi:hypothetical protein
LAKVVFKDLKIDYINIKIVFLNPIIYKEIYIILTRFLKRLFLELKHKDIYIRLRKALYSLKQAP